MARHNGRGALLAGAALTFAAAGGAQAQTTDQDPGAAVLDEVIVTAQKRTENVKDVPASITVLGEEQLERLNATQLTDYAAYVPGLIASTQGSPGRVSITLRGLAPISSTATVGTYIDDAPLGASGGFAIATSMGLDLLPYDVERIEILKGPQGTLYGANTMGGLIKYVTRRPDLDDFEARVGADFFGIENGDGPGYGLRAGVNLPLVEDVLGIRGSLFDQHTPGYVDNAFNGEEGDNAVDQSGGRLALLWRASPSVDVRLSAMTQRIETDSTAFIALDNTTLRPLFGELSSNHAVDESFDHQLDYYTATVDWGLGWADFLSATSYSVADSQRVQDGTLYYGPLLGLPDGVELPIYEAVAIEKVTQEFRLVSPSGGRLEWLVGAFFTDEKVENAQAVRVREADGAPFPGLDPLQTVEIPTRYREIAAFGTLTWKLSDRFDIGAGLRWSQNDQRYSETWGGPGGPVSTADGRSSEEVVTYSLTPRFHVTPDTLVYGRLTSGYRPGGPNVTLPGAPSEYDADSTVNYELGVKTRTADRRLSLDAAVYRIDWEDIQVSITEGSLSYLGNAGTARSQGFEVAAQYFAGGGLTLGGSVAYTDAELTEDAPSLGAADGNRLPEVPRWSGALTADYEFTLGSDLMASVGGGLRLVDARYSDIQNTYEAEAYTALDLNASLSRGPWSLRAYARNVLDERAYLTLQYFGPQTIATVLQPRTVGLALDRRF